MPRCAVPSGKTETVTTTFPPAEQEAWLSTVVRERSNCLSWDQIPVLASGLLRAESSWLEGAVGGDGLGDLLRVGHGKFQMGFVKIQDLHLNELCSKLHRTEVNLDVSIV